MFFKHISIVSVFILTFTPNKYSLHASSTNDEKIEEFLKTYNEKGDEIQHKDALAAWNYETDMTDANEEETEKWGGIFNEFSLKSRKLAKTLLENAGSGVPEISLRQLRLIQRTDASSNKDNNKELAEIRFKMINVYSDTVPVSYKKKLIQRTDASSNKDDNKELAEIRFKMINVYSDTVIKKKIDGKWVKLKLNQDLLPFMANVKKENLKNMEWVFKEWRDTVGKKMKPLFKRFVELANKGAKENGFEDYGHYWRSEYEDDNLEQTVETILEEMNPLYKKLHAHSRFLLNQIFGDKVVGKTGMIPIHLLNMWGQDWKHLYDLFVPYPNKTIPDVTSEMKKKGWSNVDLLKQAESFFVSIGLDKMPQGFFEKSLISKPKGKKPVCFPSSWDLGGGDVRIKMPCMGVSHNDFVTVHHEMGHIEYYLMYKDLPIEFRTAANPGFHEAVGDTIALSVTIPEHLASIGLLDKSTGDDEEEINFLLMQALEKVAFLPFAYIVDKWRWAVFAGQIKHPEYNTYWWQLRHKYQGVQIPLGMQRNDRYLCDAGTFFHVAHNTEYLRYFLSNVLQYQFHKALCDEAGVGKPYHKCSIHKSKKAGKKLRKMLELGKKIPSNEALKVLTGTNKMSAKALLEYFKPLEDWLDRHREKNGYTLGWD